MKPWVIAIAVMLGTAFLLFVTGNLVISTKPAEEETSSGGDAKNGSKIVYELTPEEDAAVRSAE